jgi:hypothetical protein
MALNLKKTSTDRDDELSLDVGETFEEEGKLVVSTLNADGEEVAVVGTQAAGLKVFGFSKLDTISPAFTRSYVTSAVIPAVAPFTVDIGHTLVTSDVNADGDVRVRRVDTGAYLTLVAGAPAAGEFQLSGAATGVLTFNAAEADVEVEVFARVTMTAREQAFLFQQRHINSGAQADLEVVGVINGVGTVYTDQFDESVTDWDTGTLRTGPLGTITTAAGGTDISSKMTVIHIPDTTEPFLGLRVNLP